ncbi:MAG: carotenoid biosynthesis protein [Anaerolineales bacterium]|nr:carotenoid biosynthesis protein [Anaerolineales bacterium]
MMQIFESWQALLDTIRQRTIFRPWLGSLVLWLVILIATPIVLWTADASLFPLLATMGVLAQASASVLALSLAKPGRWLLRTLTVVVVCTWLVEFIGHRTGLPFGNYYYTEALQPQLGGVPLLIPLAWLMMLAPAWGVTEILLGERRNPLLFAAVAGLAFTAWDLYLDPQMVARGLWTWEQPGAYFGIPWLNYLGWWLSAFLITLVVRPRQLPTRPLLVIYTLTWAFQAIGQGLFWGQPGPALAGFAGMGIFVLPAWRKVRISTAHEDESR